jgi:hypothetical protein
MMAKPGRPAKDTKTAGDWISRILDAKKVRKNWVERFQIEIGYDLFEGANRPQELEPDEFTGVNLVYSNLETELPTLYGVDPWIYIKLKKSHNPNPDMIPVYEQKAKIRQAMINYLKGELELKTKIRLCVQDAFFQFGCMKVRFFADEVKHPQANEPIIDEKTGQPQLDDAGTPVMYPETIPANQRYIVERVHPSDILFDADAGTLMDDVKCIYQKITVPLDDAKNDKRFKPSVREKLVATAVREDDNSDKNRENRKKGGVVMEETRDPDVVVFWEVWDLENDQWLTVSEGCDEFLLAPESVPPGTDGHPYNFLRFTLRDDSFYPVPPVSQQVEPQMNYNDIRSKIKVHRKKFNRKYELYGPGVDEIEKASDDLTTGDDGTVVVKNQPVPVVTPIPDAPLDMQVHTELSYTRNEFSEVATGTNQRGAGTGIDSATEASIIENRVQMREGDRVSLVVDFTSRIARKLDQLVQTHISRDEAIKVAGPDGEYWMMVKESDYKEIEGEYDYSVTIGATTPRLPEIERSQLMGLFQLLFSFPYLAKSERAMKKLFETHHIDDEALIKEIKQLALEMIQAQAEPQQAGSMPGSPAGSAGSVAQGQAGGSANVSSIGDRGGQ